MEPLPRIFKALRETTRNKLLELKEQEDRFSEDIANARKERLALLQQACPHSHVAEVEGCSFAGEPYYGVWSWSLPAERTCAVCLLSEQSGYSSYDRTTYAYSKLANPPTLQKVESGRLPDWLSRKALPDLQEIE